MALTSLTNFELSSSLELLLCLTSGYQGSHVAQEILLDLEHPSKPNEALAFAAKMIDEIIKWNTNLIDEGKPILKEGWKKPETEDAKLAFKMLENLKIEQREIFDLASIMQEAPIDDVSLTELSWCVAQYGRYAYSSLEHFRLLLTYGNRAEDQNLVDFALNSILSKETAYRTVIELVTVVKSGIPDPEDRIRIFRLANRIPRNALAAIHEINTCLHKLEDSLTYEMFDFESSEKSEWELLGLSPIEASTWRLHGVGSAFEVSSWIASGYNDPIQVAPWNDANFSAVDAVSWSLLDTSPLEAKDWRKAGFTPEKAKVYIEKGMRRPPSIKSKS